MCCRRAKVAFSLDAKLLARIERLRRSTGESRSAVIGRALAKLLGEERHVQLVQQYKDAYARMPEKAYEIRAARRLSERSLAQLPWRDE